MNQLHTLLRNKKPDLCFWIFIVFHVLLWTVGPAFYRPSLPHDTLEGITWGLQWQLGYNKHPFLTAWFCAAVTQWFGVVGWPVYLLAQLTVALTFWGVWTLAKALLPKWEALVAALVLEGVLFYNINSFNFTPDTLQSPLWALLALCFYYALTTQKIRYWSLTGILAACSVLTKYQGIVFLLPMLFICFSSQEARKSFRQVGFYCGLLVFFLLVMPHLLWLYQHDYVSLHYALHLGDEPVKTSLNRLEYLLRYSLNAIFDTGLLFFLLWPFLGSKQKKRDQNLSKIQWHVVLFLGLGPLVITLLLCAITGGYFPPRWSTPYFFALGILAMGLLQPSLSSLKLKKFFSTLVLLTLTLWGGRMLTFFYWQRPQSDAFLPNQHIAKRIAEIWAQHQKKPLQYIAGSNYLVSAVTPYLSPRPKPYLNWSTVESPWIDEKTLQRSGALFVWDAGHNYVWDKESWFNTTLPESVLARYPTLEKLPTLIFHRIGSRAPIAIGIAILPPVMAKKM